MYRVLESMQYLLKVHRGAPPGQHGCYNASLRVVVMVGKAGEMRKMGSVVPTLQRLVSELLICIADVTGNGSEPDLEGAPRGQLTANLQEKIVLVDGVAINNVQQHNFRGSLEKRFKPWKHAANLPLPPASGPGTAPRPAIPRGHPRPA